MFVKIIIAEDKKRDKSYHKLNFSITILAKIFLYECIAFSFEMIFSIETGAKSKERRSNTNEIAGSIRRIFQM